MKRSFVILCSALSLASPASAVTQYVAYSSHADSSCASVPTQVAYVVSSSGCSATSATCSADETTESYVAQTCVTDPKTRTTSVFGSKPWVQFEVHKSGSSCSSLASLVGYLSDGSCLIVDSASSSLQASVYANKSVSVVTFDGTACTGSPRASHLLDAGSLSGATCLQSLLLAYSSVTTTSVATSTESSACSVQSALSVLVLSLVAHFV